MARENNSGKIPDEETVGKTNSEEIVGKVNAESSGGKINAKDVTEDDFIRSLMPAERLEFSRLFLEEKAFPFLPDYIIGGDNSRFFKRLFIYWARIGNEISYGLLNKLYIHGNIKQSN